MENILYILSALRSRHSPSGEPLNGKIAGWRCGVKHFCALNLALSRAGFRLWVFHAKRRGHPQLFMPFFLVVGADEHDGCARSR